MLDLLEKLEGQSFISLMIWVVLIALAIKGLIGYLDWISGEIESADKKKKSKEKKEESIQKQLDENKREIQELKNNQKAMLEQIHALSEKIEMLIVSDKDDIKSFLTREHHYFCYQQGWIDDYSLECCERRFEHYIAEHGNSYIEGFMKEMRELPKQPPQYRKEMGNINNKPRE